MIISRLFRLCLPAGLALLLSACIQPAPKPNDPAYAPVLASPAQIAAPTGGSIYRANYGMDLFADRRAARVGDVLEVMLTERTAAKKKADTSVSKNSSADISNPLILGVPVTRGQYNLETNPTANRDFEGEGESEQNNSLQGSITVTVANVLPNGLLEIRGEKWLTLNRGEELIRLRGYVRPEDISADNRVSSTRIADARITYAGTGELADANEMGWLSKFFNSRWFPF